MCIKIVSENVMCAKKTYEECPCECIGGDIEIGLKGNYVLSMLNSIESDDVLVTLKEPRRPILWYDSLNNSKILLQMPMQLV
jgi:DNA polymerase-3 subunit beta